MFPDISSSFTGNFGNLGSSGATGSKGGLGGMDPFTAILGVGNLAAGIFGGMGQQRAAAQSMQAQLDAQKAGTEAGARIAREQAYGQLGENIAARLAGERAAELGYGLQKRAKEWELGPGFDRNLANAWQSAMRSQAAQLTPESKEISQRENRRRMRETLAEKQAAMAGLFGPIAPQSATNLFV
jgi:hypothetical protein